MTQQFLNNAYRLDSSEATRNFYKDWAASYEEEITENGYASPLRTAEALVKCNAPLNAPLLDVGCGTGLSGAILQNAGFTELQGSDFTPEMLAEAKAKEIYTHLHQADLNDPFEFVTEPFAVMTAIGVFAPGHAPPETIATIVDLLTQGGLFGFSMNDHTLENPGYMAEINRLLAERKVRVRWQEYGDHLPKIGLNSVIMVLERIT